MANPPKKPEGRPGVDDRGVSVWNWVEGNDAVGTDVVRALGDGLSLETSSEDPDPYSHLHLQEANAKHGRSLDDMRRLNEEIKRAREHPGEGHPVGTEQKRPVPHAPVVRLRWEGREMVVDERNPSIAIGRVSGNGIVLMGDRISRLHARIEIRHGTIVLVDVSTNGTYVRTADGKESLVHHGSVQLLHQGLIGFGRTPRQESPRTIFYSCEPT